MDRSVMAMLTLLLGLALPSSSIAQRPSGGGVYYTIEIEIRADGEVIGTPTLIMRTDRPALITVPTTNGYALRADLAIGSMQGQRRAELALDLRLPLNDSWVPVSSPSLSIPMGRPGSFSVPAERSRSGRAIRLDYVVTEGIPPSVGADGLGTNACSDARLADWEEDMREPVSSLVHQAALAMQSGFYCTR